MKNLQKTFAGLTLAGILAGCGNTYGTQQLDSPLANGYDITIDQVEKSKEVRIGQYDPKNKVFMDTGLIVGEDYNGDNKVDRIKIYSPLSSSLEEIASAQKLNEILEKINPKEKQ